MFRITAYLSLFIVLNSCKTQHAFVSEPLMNSGIIYEVTNRQALHWFKDMYIGKEFVAYKIKRSWTEGYHFPFILRFSGVKEKFSFMLKNTDSSENTMKAVVFCLDKIQEQELPQFIPYPFPLNYENIFSGKIILLGDTSYQALFAISEPPYIMFKEHISEGHLIIKEGDKQEIFEVKGINSYRKKNGNPGFTGKIIGYEIIDKNKNPILGVSCMNEGKIWMSPTIESRKKFFFICFSSALLLKRDLKEQHERTKMGVN